MKIFNRVIAIFILLGKYHALVKIMGDRRNSIAIKNHFMYSIMENHVQLYLKFLKSNVNSYIGINFFLKKNTMDIFYCHHAFRKHN